MSVRIGVGAAHGRERSELNIQQTLIVRRWCTQKNLGEYMRKPRGKLHFLKRLLSNKLCGKMKAMLDSSLVRAVDFNAGVRGDPG